MSKPKTAKSQCEKILKDLKAGKSVSSLTGFKKYNAIRVTARIHELEHGTFDGNKYSIQRKKVKTKNSHYLKYFMEAA